MNKDFIFLLLLIMLGCTQMQIKEPEKTVIEKIMVQCWDGSVAESANSCPPRSEINPTVNQIVPEQKTQEQPIQEGKNIIAGLLSKVPESYWFWDEDAGLGAVVYGQQRRLLITFYENNQITGWGPSNWYWNKQTGEIIVDAGQLSKACLNSSKNESPTDSYYNTKSAKFVNAYYITTLPQNKLPMSPFDWLIEYQGETPVEIRNAKESVKTPLSAASMMTDLSVKFNKKQGSGFWTFKINSKIGVPLMIEDQQDSKTVKIHKYEYDVASQNAFNRRPLKEVAQFNPVDKVLISEEDYKTYSQNRWCSPKTNFIPD